MRALNLHPWIKASINFRCKKYLEKILNSYFLGLIISVLVREKRRLSNCETYLTFILFEDMFAFDYHAFFKKIFLLFLFRTSQSKHCIACNKCVAVFDHHCRWLNNCIGEKNYK